MNATTKTAEIRSGGVAQTVEHALGSRGAPPVQCPDSTDTNEKIRREQYAESGWRSLIDFLYGDETNASPRLRRISNQYAMASGLLHKIVKGEVQPRFALVVPLSMRATVLHFGHDAPEAGHPGFLRTLHRIRLRYYWRGMKRDIRTYVASCVTCALMKSSHQRPMGRLLPLPSSKTPFEKIAIDKFGSIQNSPRGFVYVLLVVDFCTRYVIAEPIREATADVTTAFMKHIVMVHSPLEVLSDNGAEFKGSFEALLEQHEIIHKHSSPRHPKANGLVERANKSISQICRTMIQEERHEDWDDALPHAVRAYNTSIHDITGYSPYFLLFGFEARTRSFLGENVPPMPASDTRIQDLAKARNEAAWRTDESRAKQKRRYDRKRREINLSPGDLVTIEVSTLRRGQSERFNPRRRGPFEVTHVYDNNTIRVKGAERSSAVVNAERCLRILRRPKHLEYNDGLDDTIGSIARGPGSSEEETGICTSPEANFSNAPTFEAECGDPEPGNDVINNMTPLRKSSRRSTRPERLIETMSVAILFEPPAVQSEHRS